MASPSGSGASSGCSSSYLQNSGSEGDVQHHIMEERKRKRMVSNRESARRSRMRKQQHLDDLVVQIGQLKKENSQIITSMDITTKLYLDIEGENAILRVQMAELSNRLHSLNQIIQYINSRNYLFGDTHINDFGFINPCNFVSVNQPIMASADMFIDDEEEDGNKWKRKEDGDVGWGIIKSF
ncbi:bZIP transcription factor 44 [Senna tora]|uniref:BZIP transcription factor 44 n=1 Tax=Senna tora TaxID=362788 RepID=A0A834X3I6_9FABA|nr:bZIP transcription factor 44 [Senna tora]